MDTDDEAVRAQYEAYPYPNRDPADEAKRLIVGSPSHLLEIEHYVFGGRRAGPLRALIAGGGTGDAAIMLAQHLADRGEGGAVVYLDMSAASMAIAKARAEARGLANIRFHQGSLLDVADLLPGPFDYIDCCGVLHHLDDPAAGLEALLSVLAPDGGMGVMLYGALGRTGVYPLQRALRRLAGDAAPAARVAQARALLNELPETNWFRRNPFLGDHLRGDDAGLYDLLLHPRDRAFTVPEIAALCDGAGLRVTGFLPPLRYDSLLLLTDDALRRAAAALPWLEACALAEELAGNLKTHLFYAVRQDAANGAPTDPAPADAVPVLRENAPDSLARGLAKTARLKVDLDGIPQRFELPAGAADIVRLIDGRRSLQEIHRQLMAQDAKLDWLAFKGRFDRLYGLLRTLNMMLLGGPGAPPR